MLTQSEENIIKNIYDLGGVDLWVSTSALAERLAQKPASVTNMIQKLARDEALLVEYVPYRGVRLNETGIRVALEIIRHHRLLELYLSQALGVPWDRVHEEAEKLEHVLSEDLEERIAAALPDTRRDPHGSPIPTKDGQIEVLNAINLSEVAEGKIVSIAEVYDHDPGLLRYLGELGLYPGVEIRVLGREPYGGSLRFQRDGGEYRLGEDAIPHVSVILQ
jgi:DtxR family Mn-dependent transcriptional regulator